MQAASKEEKRGIDHKYQPKYGKAFGQVYDILFVSDHHDQRHQDQGYRDHDDLQRIFPGQDISDQCDKYK